MLCLICSTRVLYKLLIKYTNLFLDKSRKYCITNYVDGLITVFYLTVTGTDSIIPTQENPCLKEKTTTCGQCIAISTKCAFCADPVST